VSQRDYGPRRRAGRGARKLVQQPLRQTGRCLGGIGLTRSRLEEADAGCAVAVGIERWAGVPSTAAHTRRASGTSRARRADAAARPQLSARRRSSPPGTRRCRKPRRRAATALTRASASPAARLRSESGPSRRGRGPVPACPTGFSLARARIWRRWRAATPRPPAGRSGNRGFATSSVWATPGNHLEALDLQSPPDAHHRNADGHRDPIGERERLGPRGSRELGNVVLEVGF